jgi:UDP-glucose 4-epimerase
MSTCLVTGGAGFIGSHVTDLLIEAGHRVMVIDDLSGGYEENINPKAHFMQGSVADLDFIIYLCSLVRPEYIFHFAAYAAEGLSHFIRHFNYTNNLLGSINLINAAVNYGTKCFVFTSSMGVYGTNQLPFHEDLMPKPEDPYGISKFAVEMDLKAAHEMFGLDYVIFRPHNVYGPRQNIWDKYRNVIGIFMNQVLGGKPMTIFGDGTQTRAFSYIGDIAYKIANSIHIPESYNQIFNIGGEVPYSINQLAELVGNSLELEYTTIHTQPRYEVQDAYCSHEKVERFFGKLSQTPIENGLKEMAEWAKKRGFKEGQKWDALEVKKNLPEFWQK